MPWPCMDFRSTGITGDSRVAGEAARKSRRHGAAGLGFRSGRFEFGAEEVQEFGWRRTAELLIGRAPRIHWYSLYDLPRGVARHDAPSRSGRLRLLSPFLHGAASGGWHAKLAFDISGYTPEFGICQWFHFEDPVWDEPRVGCALKAWRALPAYWG